MNKLIIEGTKAHPDATNLSTLDTSIMMPFDENMPLDSVISRILFLFSSPAYSQIRCSLFFVLSHFTAITIRDVPGVIPLTTPELRLKMSVGFVQALAMPKVQLIIKDLFASYSDSVIPTDYIVFQRDFEILTGFKVPFSQIIVAATELIDFDPKIIS